LNFLDPIRGAQLLGRTPAAIDLAPLASHYSGRSVLVTGAAGSIGSELCRQLLAFQPRHLACLDRDVRSLADLQKSLASHPESATCSFHDADILAARTVEKLLGDYQNEIIFHAAAEKHVPLMESRVVEAIRTNVLGTASLLQAAAKHRVSQFIFVSSDKAVEPVSVVGATKRAGELLLSASPARAARCSVRFGNVLGSSGSVLEIWSREVQDGEPLTITEPTADRYFLLPTEAIALLLQVASLPGNGTYIFEMGEPVQIGELAHAFLKQHPSQAAPQFRTIGLRPGEKLHESLVSASETLLPTHFDRVHRVLSDAAPAPSWDALSASLEALQTACERPETAHQLKSRLQTLVPDYRPAINL
jgi:FlaA1/EpsC-like NDP-sugar epimerase